mmetsp:Transcript_10783/g.39975  ORF Transcript_10783/g.39975 Transcript_10783/m.39975 type:complete len:232 (+) Transcript_10783:2393-3088(+)
MRELGCFHTVPSCGTTSPVRSLIMVDLPTPFGPTHATLDARETCTLTSFTVGSLFAGYVYVTPAIFIRGFVFDLTPSMNPGCGNRMTNPVLDLSSKYDRALGFFCTYSDRFPRDCFSFSVSMAMMLLHTRSSKPVSCETMMHVTFFKLKRYSSTHFTFITSRWLVGSSMSKMSAFKHMALANASFMRHPPERNVTRHCTPFCISPNPTLSNMRSTTSVVIPAFLIRGSRRM